MATGTATVDFGAWPGLNEASVAVTGQGGILLGSNIEAYFMASDTTTDHTANDHQYAPCFIKLTCGNIVAGTGFTIYGRCQDKMQGTFLIHWVWT